MNPQIYIKKMFATKNVEFEREVQEIISAKKSQKSGNSIIKFYPPFGNNLKNKAQRMNENLAIFSYSKQPKSLDQSGNNDALQSLSVRLMDAAESIGNYVIGEDDDMAEGFYNSEGTPVKQYG